MDLALPATDAGVAVQLVVVAVAYLAALWATRANRDLVLFVTGVALLLVGLMGLRTLH